jgi:hypothetical protein
MRTLDRALTLVMCGLGLVACSSMPGFDLLKPKPTTTVLLIQSDPASAEARSSLGETCRIPCTMAIGTAGDFTIGFARDGHEPQAVTVHSTMSEGDYMTAPSPVLDPSGEASQPPYSVEGQMSEQRSISVHSSPGSHSIATSVHCFWWSYPAQ